MGIWLILCGMLGTAQHLALVRAPEAMAGLTGLEPRRRFDGGLPYPEEGHTLI